jgi:hypothetical protein
LKGQQRSQLLWCLTRCIPRHEHPGVMGVCVSKGQQRSQLLWCLTRCMPRHEHPGVMGCVSKGQQRSQLLWCLTRCIPRHEHPSVMEGVSEGQQRSQDIRPINIAQASKKHEQHSQQLFRLSMDVQYACEQTEAESRRPLKVSREKLASHWVSQKACTTSHHSSTRLHCCYLKPYIL